MRAPRAAPSAPPAGRVVSVQVSDFPHRQPTPQPIVRAIPEVGIHGDRHARPGSPRQVLLVDAEVLRSLGLRPGDLREQITVELPGLMDLPPGTRLGLGEAVLEVTGPCRPCTHIGEDLGDADPENLRIRLEGRRGILASVTSATGEGRIRPGDGIRVLEEPGLREPTA